MNFIWHVKGIFAVCLYWSSKLTVLYSNQGHLIPKPLSQWGGGHPPHTLPLGGTFAASVLAPTVLDTRAFGASVEHQSQSQSPTEIAATGIYRASIASRAKKLFGRSCANVIAHTILYAHVILEMITLWHRSLIRTLTCSH